MIRIADITEPTVENGAHTLTYDQLSSLSVQRAERKLDSFLAELRQMTPDERISASLETTWLRC
jgi:hypothetical protein